MKNYILALLKKIILKFTQNKILSIYVFASLSVLIGFQNCSGGFKSKSVTAASLVAAGSNYCAKVPNDPACLQPQSIKCTFNGNRLNDGQSVTAYLSSSVLSGQTCKSENRVCRSGVLSGSYSYATCAINQPAACLFNGKTVAHGQSVTAYLNSTTGYGTSCTSETRTCNNGVLSGSYSYGACSVSAAASCNFNGVTVAHNQSVAAYPSSSVAFGQTCQSTQRTCNNGVLSGSGDFSSCTVSAVSSCAFNNQTIAHGQSVTAYQNASVDFGQTCQSQTRTCTNGSLSGNYLHASCFVGTAAACDFNGVSVPHNQSVTAYAASSVEFGQTCQGIQRTCYNGSLSGSGSFASCTPQQPKACLFNGQTVAHGQSTTAYATSTVPFGQTCQSQTRTCYNGALSGAGDYGSCTVAQPAACLFNGQTVVSGQSVTAYTTSNVPYGQTCQAQTRLCTNGSFSGQGDYASCTVDQGQACLINGQTIAHGGSITLYLSSVVAATEACQAQARVCTNGSLSGSAMATSCMVTPYSIAQPTGLNAVIASNPTYLDYLIQDVCTDDFGNITTGDPATCPKHRNIRLGEKFPYFVSDRDGNGTGARYQANWSYPVAGPEGNLKVITFKEFRNLNENYSFNNFSVTESGFDFIEFSSSYVSGTRTSDPGCYDQIFSTDGGLYNRQNAWAFFPVGDPETFPASSSGTFTTYGTPISYPRKCNPGNSTGITYWHSPMNITFESGKTLRAVKSMHFAGTALNQQNNALELYYFTREYGFTRWEAWIPQSRCYAEKTGAEAAVCNPAGQHYLSGRCSSLNVSSTGVPGLDTWGGQYWVRVDCRDTTYYQALNTPTLPLDNVMAQNNGIVDVDYTSTMTPPQAIPAGTVLYANQQIKIGASALVMQADGNLVLYGPGGNGLWASSLMPDFYVPGASAAQNTNCSQCFAYFQADGNIVLYNPNSNYNIYHSYWASNTGGSYGSLFTVSAAWPYLKVTNASGIEAWNGNTLRRWNANDPAMGHLYGSANGNGWHVGADGQYKILTYGPYASGLPAGNLRAVFQLQVDYNSNSEAVIDIDVYRNSTNTLFAKATLVRTNFSQANKILDFALPFQYDGAGDLEFRVSVYGNSYVHHEATRIEKAP